MIVVKKAELLAPAGNVEKLKTAIHYGADAVFLGGKMFNLRAGSNNFSDEELEECVQYAHERGKRVYVTLNIIPHNEELEQLPDYVKFLEKIGVDAVIVADLGVFQVVKENSNLAISVSTQASNTNWRSVKMWKDMGAKRVVLAREISLDNILEIRQKVPDIELEVFVHGAMCMSVSGRCLLSNYMTGRDANRGDCAQSCRWKYSVVEETRPGEYMPVYEDERGTYIFSSKDLCTIEFIDKILELGVDSLKIEGRMKGIFYVANVVKVYRDALDSFYSGNYKYNPQWKEELEATSNRSYTDGFYKGNPGTNGQNYNNRNSYSQTHQLVAKVEEKISEWEYILAIRNRLFVGETLEIISPGISVRDFVMPEMLLWNKGREEGEVKQANPNSFVKIITDIPLSEMDMLRKKL
ncbi:protease [Fusobacterium necrophorum subsp. funduliforme]|uniref:Protease n=1 Tax=Fusobacterium necrophorum subsp. funduliforme TaxID=143387 RepID=A0A162IXB7_9FUSO|nr:U32 family peptidase [Fusobacterium necrophorum subsp. funduliforme]KYL04639.1 protease [Fusobacterium necrophorum subsp. funduliforme]KYM44290.1 protease [Fusobacterium necrophorum subsp. funduliforme]KYM62090.1 protease [Fusobacterium necrophorum subsp. funduliforme]KYM64041.1 protease [Fusobacterium necrophorum subsp. funduliforme]